MDADQAKKYQNSFFAKRTLIDYKLSPGTQLKFNTIEEFLMPYHFETALDVGCSGNSFLLTYPHINNRVYCDITHTPLVSYSFYQNSLPARGNLLQLPFKSNTFDLITALDVIEHVDDDQGAIQELVRVLKPGGICIITVPHRKKYFNLQDKLMGHFRRYEYSELKQMLDATGMKFVSDMRIYGQLLKFQFLDEMDIKSAEERLDNLRNLYCESRGFRKLWNVIATLGRKVMWLDSHFQSFNKLMDIGFVYRKIAKSEY